MGVHTSTAKFSSSGNMCIIDVNHDEETIEL